MKCDAGVEGSNANAGAVSVPLVALACQGGNLELVDTAANTITASFAVHNNQTVRGVRWLGNKRLVSFSYVEVLQSPKAYDFIRLFDFSSADDTYYDSKWLLLCFFFKIEWFNALVSFVSSLFAGSGHR